MANPRFNKDIKISLCGLPFGQANEVGVPAVQRRNDQVVSGGLAAA
jgi:hypothetical protein